MHAAIRTGGEQYLVPARPPLRLERLPRAPGDTVRFEDVLLVGGDTPKIGQPFVSGASVAAQIVGAGRGKKIVVFKFRRRKNYRRKTGHRQPFTELKITGIKL